MKNTSMPPFTVFLSFLILLIPSSTQAQDISSIKGSDVVKVNDESPDKATAITGRATVVRLDRESPAETQESLKPESLRLQVGDISVVPDYVRGREILFEMPENVEQSAKIGVVGLDADYETYASNRRNVAVAPSSSQSPDLDTEVSKTSSNTVEVNVNLNKEKDNVPFLFVLRTPSTTEFYDTDERNRLIVTRRTLNGSASVQLQRTTRGAMAIDVWNREKPERYKKVDEIHKVLGKFESGREKEEKQAPEADHEDLSLEVGLSGGYLNTDEDGGWASFVHIRHWKGRFYLGLRAGYADSQDIEEETHTNKFNNQIVRTVSDPLQFGGAEFGARLCRRKPFSLRGSLRLTGIHGEDEWSASLGPSLSLHYDLHRRINIFLTGEYAHLIDDLGDIDNYSYYGIGAAYKLGSH